MASAIPVKIEFIPVEDLQFDRQNARLAGYGLTAKSPDEEVIKTLWDEMAVDEIAMSVAASGFWPQEPLIVAREKGKQVG
jgi:hypothetical protein